MYLLLSHIYYAFHVSLPIADEDRFRSIIEQAIEAKEVKRFKAFAKRIGEDEKRRKNAEKVRRPLEKTTL